jgi:hypothetical protein
VIVVTHAESYLKSDRNFASLFLSISFFIQYIMIFKQYVLERTSAIIIRYLKLVFFYRKDGGQYLKLVKELSKLLLI